MNILVLVKQVPDTTTRVQDRIKDGRLELGDVTWIANPYDEYAVEEALRLRERNGGAVTLLTLGPERAASALKDMLALGADEGVHLSDPAFDDLDARGTATVLAAAARRLPFDMIWTGWKGVDFDEAQVPSYLAHDLDLPYVAAVTEFEVEDGKAHVKREIEGGKETLTVPLPAVFGAQKGLNEVRYASLKGIMAVKRKQIPVWGPADLDLDASALPRPGLEVMAFEPPPDRASGRVIEGAPDEAAREVIRLLHEEAKVL